MTICKGNDVSHNLFDYATSELSQDAFFCWLLSYSTKESKEEYGDVFRVSQRFLKSMLNKDDKEDSLDYYVTNIERQKKVALNNDKGYIDIFVTIEKAGDKCYLIIEDKIDTWEHNQLELYYKAIDEEFGNQGFYKIYVAFVKTEYMIHMEEKYMEKFKVSEIPVQQLKIMKQEEVCQILDEGDISESNVILKDFVLKLKRKINREAFTTENLKNEFGKESTQVYKFFDYLIQNKISMQNNSFCWCGYVNNARGGFHCLTWNEHKFDRQPFESIYLQMEVYPYNPSKRKSETRIALKLKAFEENDEEPALSCNLEVQIKELKNAINKRIEAIGDKVFKYEGKYFRLGHTMRAGYIQFDIDTYEEAMKKMNDYMTLALEVLKEKGLQEIK